MKIQLKVLEGTKWHPVAVEKLVGKTINSFILGCEQPAIACLYDGDKKIAYISNHEETLASYKNKAFCMLASDLEMFLDSELDPLALVIGGDFIEVKKL